MRRASPKISRSADDREGCRVQAPTLKITLGLTRHQRQVSNCRSDKVEFPLPTSQISQSRSNPATRSSSSRHLKPTHVIVPETIIADPFLGVSTWFQTQNQHWRLGRSDLLIHRNLRLHLLCHAVIKLPWLRLSISFRSMKKRQGETSNRKVLVLWNYCVDFGSGPHEKIRVVRMDWQSKLKERQCWRYEGTGVRYMICSCGRDGTIGPSEY